MTDAIRYDGLDDTVLPDRLQKILPLLPARAAGRLRDWLTNYGVDEIEEQLDYILGGDPSFAPSLIQPPINRDGEAQEAATVVAPADAWGAAEEAVGRIAAMYKTLSGAGMSEQTAVAIIADEVNDIRMAGRTQSGFATIPVAGARVTLQRRTSIPGVEDYTDYNTTAPMAGWPPQPIK